MYIAQARSIVENSIDNLIEQQKFLEQYSSELHGPFLYPWGFPILLVPVYKNFGLNILAMKFYIFLFFIGSLFIMFFLFDELNEKYRLLLVSMFAFNPVFFYFKENILSDIPFLFFSLFGMFLIKRFIIEKRFLINENISFFLLGFVMFFTYYIRLQGAILFFVFFICHYKNYVKALSLEHWKFIKEKYLHLVPYLAFVFCLNISRNIFSESFRYFSEVFLNQDIFETIKNNIVYYAILPSEFFSSKTLLKLIYIVTIPFAFYGFVVNVKKEYFFTLFVILNQLVLLSFPYTTQGIRYIFIILPYYIYYFIKGFIKFKEINFKLPYKKWIINFMHILLVLLIGSYLLRDMNYIWKTYRDNFKTAEEGPYSKDASEMISFIKNNTKEDDKVVFFKPRALRLYTNRTTIVNYNLDEITKYKFKYVVVYRYDFEKDNRIKFINNIERSNLFMKIFNNDNYIIYELINEQA
ncbi:MAG: hypothetical protein QXJ06_01775 [Candidatus Aenigmatarchaeota archaeon]